MRQAPLSVGGSDLLVFHLLPPPAILKPMWAALIPMITSLLSKHQQGGGGGAAAPHDQLPGSQGPAPAYNQAPPVPSDQSAPGQYDPSKMEALKDAGKNTDWFNSATSASGY